MIPCAEVLRFVHLYILEFLHTNSVLAIHEEMFGGIHDCHDTTRETMLFPYRRYFHTIVEVKDDDEMLPRFIFDLVHGSEVGNGFHDFNEEGPVFDRSKNSISPWVIVVPQVDIVIFRKLVKGWEMVL
jgi:hypothetical protein